MNLVLLINVDFKNIFYIQDYYALK